MSTRPVSGASPRSPISRSGERRWRSSRRSSSSPPARTSSSASSRARAAETPFGISAAELLLVRGVAAGDSHARPLVEPRRPRLVLRVDLEPDLRVATRMKPLEAGLEQREPEASLARVRPDGKVEHPAEPVQAEAERGTDNLVVLE